MAGGSGLIGKDFSGKFEQFDIASGTSPNFEEVGENIWKVLINGEEKLLEIDVSPLKIHFLYFEILKVH